MEFSNELGVKERPQNGNRSRSAKEATVTHPANLLRSVLHSTFASTCSLAAMCGSGGGMEECGARGSMVMGAGGNLYGTTTQGGAYGNGVVRELSP